jgi:tRNA-modifying protein YgfZ
VSAFAVDRSPRGLVVVTGADATSFLQSIVSQDLDPVAVGEATPALLLSPQGKLEVAFRALRLDDRWWLDTDAEYGPRLEAGLRRYRIRVKVDLEDRTADTGLATLVGRDAPPGVSAELHALPTRWGEQPGVDLLGPRAAVEAALAALPPDVERPSDAAFEAFRIEAGVPKLGVDVDERTIPQEAFLERDAVSFTKGCFLGQELVCRIDTRGHVNRYLRRVRLAGPQLPPAGAAVVVDGQERGTVTSAAAVPGGDRIVALAMVRREVEPPASVVVRWDRGEAPAELLAA